MKYVVENGNIHEYQAGKYENGVIFPTVELAQEYVNLKQKNQKVNILVCLNSKKLKISIKELNLLIFQIKKSRKLMKV